MSVVEPLRAPFPWFGGKARAADVIWQAFGADVPNYVEPFAGSLAVLLARPGGPGKVETANDKDGFIANFWRAVAAAPDEVDHWTDWPVNEADLHARHGWLVAGADSLHAKLLADPEYYDAKIAGWWCWGLCTWIGNGWCYPDQRLDASGPGVIRKGGRPSLSSVGMGVHRRWMTMPKVGTPGHGVHAPSRKKPLTHRGKGVHATGAAPDLFGVLAARLRGVRVCCGDWKRVLGRSTLGIDTRHGMTPCAVLLDPPYDHTGREKRLYREDAPEISGEVRAWALDHGDNPDLRIALCGQAGEHQMPSSWREIEWRSTSSAKSRCRERIWFSPYCRSVSEQRSLSFEASA